MEAQDTVMPDKDIRILLKDHTRVRAVSDLERIFNKIATAQAEISFKAGIKEVLDWIRSNCGTISQEDPNRSDYGDLLHIFRDKGLRAKLQEWGISREVEAQAQGPSPRGGEE